MPKVSPEELRATLTNETATVVGAPSQDWENASVLIGVPATGTPMWYPAFGFSYRMLLLPSKRGDVPAGTTKNGRPVPVTQVGLIEPKYAIGKSTAESRENIASRAVALGYDYVFMLDHDMVYPHDTLLRLLAAQKDVVVGYSVARQPQHQPIYGEPGGEPFMWRSRYPTPTGERKAPQRLSGVQPTAVAGGAGLLIKTSVLEKLPKPWFSFQHITPFTGADVGEDCYFSQAAMDAGFSIWCHTDVVIGHINHVVITPTWSDEASQWELGFEGVSEPYAPQFLLTPLEAAQSKSVALAAIKHGLDSGALRRYPSREDVVIHFKELDRWYLENQGFNAPDGYVPANAV